MLGEEGPAGECIFESFVWRFGECTLLEELEVDVTASVETGIPCCRNRSKKVCGGGCFLLDDDVKTRLGTDTGCWLVINSTAVFLGGMLP